MEEFEVERKTLKPGDHIYAWRFGGIYAHHGVFDNERRVIHFLARAGSSILSTSISSRSSQRPGSSILSTSISSRSSQMPPCQVCGDQSMACGVISSCLDCFLYGDKLYRFEYGVSQPYFESKRGGTCTTLRSDESDNVRNRAEDLLQNGFGEYNLVTNNCEDFALYCKTGKKGMSGQVRTVLTLFEAGLKAGLEAGLKAGLEAAKKAGLKAGLKVGLKEGLKAGLKAFEAAKEAAKMAGLDAGLNKGLEAGLKAGLEAGLKAGSESGLESGWKPALEAAWKTVTYCSGSKTGTTLWSSSRPHDFQLGSLVDPSATHTNPSQTLRNPSNASGTMDVGNVRSTDEGPSLETLIDPPDSGESIAE